MGYENEKQFDTFMLSDGMLVVVGDYKYIDISFNKPYTYEILSVEPKESLIAVTVKVYTENFDSDSITTKYEYSAVHQYSDCAIVLIWLRK